MSWPTIENISRDKNVYYDGEYITGNIEFSGNYDAILNTINIEARIYQDAGDGFVSAASLGEVTYTIENGELPSRYSIQIINHYAIPSPLNIYIFLLITDTNNNFFEDELWTSSKYNPSVPPLLDIQPYGVGFLTSANTGGVYSLNIKEDAKVIGFYPIGSLYFSINSTNPSNYFGGTWELFGPGRTIKSTSDIPMHGETQSELTDGEKTHQLTINEMPAHTHKYRNRTNATSGSGRLRMHSWGLGASTAQPGLATDYVGGGQPHNNMQPYVTCYIWKRTG